MTEMGAKHAPMCTLFYATVSSHSEAAYDHCHISSEWPVIIISFAFLSIGEETGTGIGAQWGTTCGATSVMEARTP
jgi:hypothetical protein